jgi:hypothetical protein
MSEMHAPRLRAPAVAAAVMALAAGILVVFFGGVAGSPSAYVSGQTVEVLHAVGSMQSTEGSRVSTSRHELWFDPVTLDTRYTTAAADGTNAVTQFRQDRTAHIYNHDRNQVITNTATIRQSAMVDVAARLLGYRSALQRQQIQIIRRGEFEGRPAVLVQGQAFGLSVRGWLERTSLVPLEETFFERSGGVLERVEWSYAVLEELPREQVPPDAFSVSIPSNAAAVRSRYMTSSEATTFRDFDIYYLGETYGDLPLFAITHRAISGVGPLAPGQTSANVAITYLRGDTKLSLDQRPASTYLQRESAPGIPALGEAVSVNGNRATIYSYAGGTDLEIRIGSTVVVIFGRDSQQVLQAATALRKLN